MGGGSSKGGGSYSGPSETEIQQQKDAYKAQWDMEEAQKDQKEMIDAENLKKEEAKKELESRRGVDDTLANRQRGFSSNRFGFTSEDEEDNIQGVM